MTGRLKCGFDYRINRPPQTAIGRTAGTLLGSAPVPVAVFGVAPKTVSQIGFHAPPHPGPLPQLSLAERENRPPSFEKLATGLAGQLSEKSKTCQGDSFSQGEKARMRASVNTNFLSASFVVHPPQTAFGRVFADGPGVRIVPMPSRGSARSTPPDQPATKSPQPSLVMPPAASWDNSRSVESRWQT